jgi:hypothetical protein
MNASGGPQHPPSLDLQGNSPLPEGADAALPTAEVGELFGVIDKAVRSRRLYQANNPVYHGFINGARQALASLWDRVPSLSATVEEHGFRWSGRLFPTGEGRDSLPFLFYRDGVRAITFLPGFENEVEKFLDVINRARQQDQQGGDEDMVTLLWQHEFECFHYSYVDALAEGLQVPHSTVPRLAGTELTLTPEGEPTGGGEDPEHPHRPPHAGPVAADQPPASGLISRSEFEETLYFLEPGELAKLRLEVEAEMKRDVRRDVLLALFDRLEDGLPTWKTEALRILRQMLPSFLVSGDLRSATVVLVQLNELLDGGTLSDEYRDDVQALFRELNDPAVLTQLLHSLEDGSIDPASDELGIFLRHLGPAAMPVLLASIERSVAGALQQRLRTAMEGLAAAHRDQLAALLRHPDSDVVRGAARMTGELGMAEAIPALAELMQRSDPSLRRTVVEALTRLRTASAMDVLQRSLTDGDREVRIAAARGIASLRYPPARARLEELLDSRIVREADLTEKIAFFEAYGALANADSVVMLDRLLNGRRLLGRANPEMRACAAMALGKVGSPTARAALQKSKEDPNPMVRNAVQKSLRQEQRAAPP